MESVVGDGGDNLHRGVRPSPIIHFEEYVINIDCNWAVISIVFDFVPPRRFHLKHLKNELHYIILKH